MLLFIAGERASDLRTATQCAPVEWLTSREQDHAPSCAHWLDTWLARPCTHTTTEAVGTATRAGTASVLRVGGGVTPCHAAHGRGGPGGPGAPRPVQLHPNDIAAYKR